MATSRIFSLSLVALFVTLCHEQLNAQSSPELAPSPLPAGPDCETKVYDLADCLTFVMPGSNLTVPEKPCCPALAGLVATAPVCLCELLGKSDSLGIKIDVSKALKLPTVCQVSTPPLSACSFLGIPIGVPTASETPELSPGPSSGVKDANGVSNLAASSLTFIIGLGIAFFHSFF